MDKQRSIKAILFDFDGTIVDLRTDYDRIRCGLSKYFNNFGIKKEFKPMLKKIDESIEELKKKKKGGDADKIRKQAYQIIDAEELKAADKAELKKGAFELLHFLKKEKGKKKKVVIISRNGRNIINYLFNKFNLPKPDLILSRDDVKEIKPSKDHIEKALVELNLKRNECIIVGDTFHDIEAGLNNNINVILVAEDIQKLKSIIA